ncbi:hypothetical protein RSOLAG1IB_09703 [Rhizoctonia solani AG-1 IB]|uniref:Uncharacterized protein n=1 Tax=Thanatephorus cucumeris (strain AG1-IB / isolate 7/3/14) TaxID=1108050 RepID=A0A0B7FRB2_THACB|nr:hypothetical protein RSOLAG1IB_09703 [Rhizoctonia solani AG-1 IB]
MHIYDLTFSFFFFFFFFKKSMHWLLQIDSLCLCSCSSHRRLLSVLCYICISLGLLLTLSIVAGQRCYKLETTN